MKISEALNLDGLSEASKEQFNKADAFINRNPHRCKNFMDSEGTKSLVDVAVVISNEFSLDSDFPISVYSTMSDILDVLDDLEISCNYTLINGNDSITISFPDINESISISKTMGECYRDQ